MKLRKAFGILIALVIVLSSVVARVSLVKAAVGTINSMYPTSGTVGSSVTITGSGFTASTTFYVKFGVNTVTSGQTTSSGALSAYFSVPLLSRISFGYDVTVTTTATDTSNTVYFQIVPDVGLTTTSGNVGDTVFLSGRGFKESSASSPISIYFDNAVVQSNVTTSTSGSFSNVSFTVPEAARGSHTVKGRDSIGYSESVIFTVNQKMSVSPTSGSVADKIAVSGTGFAASSNISLYWDDAVLSTETATTNSAGSFNIPTLSIPASSRGSHTIKAEDASGNEKTASFAIGQRMSMTPATGLPGTVITVTGSGFEASKAITVTYNAARVNTNPAVVTTDSSGSFNATFNAPAGLPGTFTVQVSDGTYTSSTTFTATLEAEISQETTPQAPGNVGMQLTVSGSGFKPNATVTIYYQSDVIELAKTTSDGSGSFSITVTIPASTGGEHTITASDGTTIKNFPFYMESTPPQTPQLALPITTDKVKTPKVKGVTQFDWNDASDPSGLTYTFQIATDKDFTKVAIERKGLVKSDYTLAEEEKLPNNKRSAPYYWRVKAIDGAYNESAWSVAQPFNVGFSFELTGWLLYVVLGLAGLLLFLIGYLLGSQRGMTY